MAGRRPSTNRLRSAKQEDVANAAGVSIATVSHVLSGRTDRVSEPTRQKVMDAVRRLGYKAPPADLRSRETHTHLLGVLVPDLTESPILRDHFFRTILDRILSVCLLRGWGVTIMAERMWPDSGQAIRRTYDGRCDGVLVVAAQDDELVIPLVERGVPVVQVATTSRIPYVSSVDVDNYKIGREAAQHLVENGHRRLAFAGKTAMIASRERICGFIQAAEELGAEVIAHDFETFMPREEVKAKLPEWIAADRTAIFCWSDDLACFIYKGLAEQNRRIPQDVSVIAVNDGRAATLRPPLTTFAPPLETIASRSVEMLLSQILGGHQGGEKVLYDAELIVRKSVAKL